MHKHLLPYEIVDKLKCSQVVKKTIDILVNKKNVVNLQKR